MRAKILAVAVLGVMVIAGCGGGDSTDGGTPDDGAIGLTGWLPTDAPAYAAIDVSSLKMGLDLPPDADPMGEEIADWTVGSWVGLYISHPALSTIRALDLPAVTQVADRLSGKDVEPMTAMRTTSDTGEIRGALLELGFVDRDGILEGPDGERATGTEDADINCKEVLRGRDAESKCLQKLKNVHGALAVRIEDDVILLSPDAEVLAAAPDSPGDPPLEVLSMLDGDVAFANGYGYRCVTQNGMATNPDGSGEMVAIYDGSPDEIEVAPDPGADSGVSEPAFDGDVVTVELGLPEPMSPRQFQSDKFAGIFCD